MHSTCLTTLVAFANSEQRGLQTIMDACQRHPSLAAHFYEADFALKRRRSLDMRREFRAVTLPLLQRMVMPSSASALPLHICSRILDFAEPVLLPSWDLWTAKAPATLAVLFGPQVRALLLPMMPHAPCP